MNLAKSIVSCRANATDTRNGILDIDVASRAVSGESAGAMTPRIMFQVLAIDGAVTRCIEPMAHRSAGIQPAVGHVDNGACSVRVDVCSAVVDGDVDMVEHGD